jgi:hypothetical protein
MQQREGTKKCPIKCWIYNGDNGPEVYELDEHGRLKGETKRRRTRHSNVPKPPLSSIDAKMQTLGDSANSASSSIGEVDTSPAQTKSNHTQFADFVRVSDRSQELTLSTSSSNRELDAEDVDLFLQSDLDFEFSDFDRDSIC